MLPDEHPSIATEPIDTGTEPRQLWPEDVPKLQVDHHPRVGADEAEALLARSPGSSFWIPATSEFILVTPWRHRHELVTVHTFGAFANEDRLLDAAIAQARIDQKAAFVVVDLNETRHPSFYARHGLNLFEEIVTYEHRRPMRLPTRRDSHRLRFVQVTESDPGLLDAVKELDHLAFPWFWWNSDEEFDVYLDYPGVEIWAGIRDHEIVSYAGITQYRRWSHLDRIATRPDDQGTGIGRATLAFAMNRMVQRGGRRVALSTQGNNARSRALYERSGFDRTPHDDYSIFVTAFDDAHVFDRIPGPKQHPSN